MLTIEVHLGMSIQSFKDEVLMLRIYDVCADVESGFVVGVLGFIFIEL